MQTPAPEIPHCDTSPLRIAHVVSGISREAAGPSYSVPALAASQGRAGHEVTLHSLGAAVSQAHNDWHDLRHARDWVGLPSLQKLGKSRALQTALATTGNDVLHAHGLWQMPFIYAAQVAQTTGKPLVLAPRGMLSTSAMQVSKGRKRLFARAVQDKALRRVSMFHATAVSEYDEIREYGLTQPVAIIPNGIDVPAEKPLRRTGNTRTILCLGRIHPHKGLDVLINAWAQVEKDHPNWQLRLVGPDQVGHVADLHALIGALSLQRVTISEPRYGAEKWRTYAAADLFALPSRSENFAITAAEAMGSSLPVISSKGAPWSGLETHQCGWWVDLGVSEFAAAMDTAMALDDAARAAMGSRGRAWMQRDFSWVNIAQDMTDAYRWLLDGGPIPSCVRVD